MDNMNTKEYLEKIKTQVIENLSRTRFAPSVQIQDVPRDTEAFREKDNILDDEDEDKNPDVRMTQRRWDKRIEHENELSDSEDEDMNKGMGIRSENRPKRRRNHSYQEPLSNGASGVATPAMPARSPAPAVDSETASEVHHSNGGDAPLSNLRTQLPGEAEGYEDENEDDDMEMADAEHAGKEDSHPEADETVEMDVEMADPSKPDPEPKKEDAEESILSSVPTATEPAVPEGTPAATKEPTPAAAGSTAAETDAKVDDITQSGAV